MKRIIHFLCMTIVFSLFLVPTNASLVPAGETPDPATVKAAFAEFKSLSKKEKKARIKEVKKQVKLFKKEKRENKSSKVEMVVLIILAILLPPLAVYLHHEEINGRFWLCILLWFCFILPGVIYALLDVTDTI